MMPDTPTPETHVYKGMWRPPWEPLLREFYQKQFDGAIDDEYQPVPMRNCFSGEPDEEFCYPDEQSLREDYIAGHFDVPQYEPRWTDAMASSMKRQGTGMTQ